MIASETLARLRDVIEMDQTTLPDAALRMANAIEARHGEAVSALVFYGSALREDTDPSKMLDFYVVVKSYRAIYPNPLLRLATWLLPPGVHFMQVDGEDGQQFRSKYAVISERAFQQRVSGGLETMIWARFVQPVIVHANSPGTRDEIVTGLARACAHFYRQTAPLIGKGENVWSRGLAESYRTELRPEDPDARAREIIDRTPGRYAVLSDILSNTALGSPWVCSMKWKLRRMTGKPRGALRVLKSAFTFDAGLDYILEKVRSHSGVEIEVSDAARRHPVLHAPVIAVRLYRAGAFK
ncbi:MAG: hypothetical protein ABJ327_21625 [Litoreibacter sp.]